MYLFIFHNNIKKIVNEVCEKYNAEIDLEIRKGYPALHNDKEFTKKQIFYIFLLYVRQI